MKKINTKNALIGFVVTAGVIFQFALLAYLCYMNFIVFQETKELNEMITGALIGLMTGVGLSASISYLLSTSEIDDNK